MSFTGRVASDILRCVQIMGTFWKRHAHGIFQMPQDHFFRPLPAGKRTKFTEQGPNKKCGNTQSAGILAGDD